MRVTKSIINFLNVHVQILSKNTVYTAQATEVLSLKFLSLQSVYYLILTKK